MAAKLIVIRARSGSELCGLERSDQPTVRLLDMNHCRLSIEQQENILRVIINQ